MPNGDVVILDLADGQIIEFDDYDSDSDFEDDEPAMELRSVQAEDYGVKARTLSVADSDDGNEGFSTPCSLRSTAEGIDFHNALESKLPVSDYSCLPASRLRIVPYSRLSFPPNMRCLSL